MRTLEKIISGILIGFTAFSLSSCKPAVEEKPKQEVIETYEETEQEKEEIVIEPEKSALELELEKIDDVELKEKIETELKKPFFANAEQKIDYVSDVINMNNEGMLINYLFDNGYLNNTYNPNEKITWVRSFDRLDFDKRIADALLIKLSEAENKLDADEDGFYNLTEVSGKDENGNPLPFLDKDTGEPITYENKDGEIVHDSSSNPLDPKDTPESMAMFDFVYIVGAVEELDGKSTVEKLTNNLLNYYTHIKDNPHLDDILLVNKGKNTDYSENLSFSDIIKRISNFSNSDYIFISWDSPGSLQIYDKNSYLGHETLTEQQVLNLCNLLYEKYGDDAIFQFTQCRSGNLSRLPDSGINIMQSTDSGIIIGVTPPQNYTHILNSNPFMDLGKAHNISVDFDVVRDFEILGLQYCAKKLDDGEIIYWDKNGAFEYAKDSNGNFIREDTGQIIRNYNPEIKTPETHNFFENHRFK